MSFVGCLTSPQHASVSQGRKDGRTERQKERKTDGLTSKKAHRKTEIRKLRTACLFLALPSVPETRTVYERSGKTIVRAAILRQNCTNLT